MFFNVETKLKGLHNYSEKSRNTKFRINLHQLSYEAENHNLFTAETIVRVQWPSFVRKFYL